MGNIIRAEVSENNPYWIEKHRYYELKHFCLQYPIWKRNYVSLDGLSSRSSSIGRATDCSVLLLFYFLSKGELVNECLLKN